jgi:hypothetical protein
MPENFSAQILIHQIDTWPACTRSAGAWLPAPCPTTWTERVSKIGESLEFKNNDVIG